MHNGELEPDLPAVSNDITMLHQDTIANEVERMNKKLNDESKRKGECKVLLISAMTQDQGKEEDLVLAAKLGKALLERNHELTPEYYKLSRKLEVRGMQLVDYTFFV